MSESRIGSDAEKAKGKMPLWRFTREGILDVVEIEALTAEEAEAKITRDLIQTKGQGEFRLTRIEEVRPDFTGYLEVTTRDVLEEKRRA